MSDDAPSMSTAQQVAVNIGVGIKLLNDTAAGASKLVGVCERIKTLFTGAQTTARSSADAINASLSSIGSGAGGASGVSASLGAMAVNFNALVQAGQTVMGVVRSMAALHSAAEQTRNTIAGTFTALGFAGDMTEGLGLARDVLRQINRDAAALPGTAQDYITVFQAGLPSLASGFGNNLTDMTAFSNRFAAIGVTFGENAAEVGADMTRMIQEGRGGAISETAMFRHLTPFINNYRSSMHQAAVTAQSFNAMTQADRVNLLASAMKGLGPMLDNASNSFDALSGSIESSFTQMGLDITEPMFESLKHGMARFNTWLTSNQERITALGLSISNRIAAGMEVAMDRFEEFGAAIRQAPWFAAVSNLPGRIADAAAEIAGDEGALAGVQTMAMQILMGPFGVLASSLLLLGEQGYNFGAVITPLINAFNNMLPAVASLAGIYGVVTQVFADLLAGVLPGFAQMLEYISSGLAEFLGVISPIIGEIGSELHPYIVQLGAAIGGLIASIGELVRGAFSSLIDTTRVMWAQYRDDIIPVLRNVVIFMTEFVGVIRDFIHHVAAFLNHRENSGVRGYDGPGSAAAAAAAAAATTTATAAAAHTTPHTPATRGGHVTHNDFRNSRFDISQQFAEGFDPDRIAAAFTTDLENSINNRLGSSFDPLFSIPT